MSLKSEILLADESIPNLKTRQPTLEELQIRQKCTNTFHKREQETATTI